MVHGGAPAPPVIVRGGVRWVWVTNKDRDAPLPAGRRADGKPVALIVDDPKPGALSVGELIEQGIHGVYMREGN